MAAQEDHGRARYEVPQHMYRGNDLAFDQYQYRMELKEESSLAIGGATGSHQLKFGAHVQVAGRDDKQLNIR